MAAMLAEHAPQSGQFSAHSRVRRQQAATFSTTAVHNVATRAFCLLNLLVADVPPHPPKSSNASTQYQAGGNTAAGSG